MNRLVRAFIEFMDAAALVESIEAGFSPSLSLAKAKRSRKSALNQLVAMHEEAEKFDSQFYSVVIAKVLAQAPEHPENRTAIMTLFHEYCRFQCGLKLLSEETTLCDELDEQGLEALTELKPDEHALRPYGEETIRVFEDYVASGSPCLGPEYRVLTEIIACASVLYGIELSAEVVRVMNHHCGGGDEDSDPSSPTRILQ